MKFSLSLLFVFLTSSFVFGQGLQSNDFESRIAELHQLLLSEDHCEVPCGIYNDSVRVLLLKEHAATIEKAMNQINEGAKTEPMNHNQMIRWVMNKEKHAEEMQEIVSQYFLHQRIKVLTDKSTKSDEMKYFTQLELLHKISVYAMKTKQTTDLDNVKKLNDVIHSFEHSYFGHDDHKHPHKK